MSASRLKQIFGPNSRAKLAGPAKSAACGFAMGTADLVPGVSGGTIAFLLGIYDRFIGSVSKVAAFGALVVKGDFKQARQRFTQVDWKFLLSLATGILLAVFALAPVMERLLKEFPEEMAGVFMGIVLASLATTWQHERSHDAVDRSTKSRWLQNLLALAVAAGVFALLGVSAAPQQSPSLWVYFGSGALAICAMVLPGISGSFILLMVGMYAAMLSAIGDLELSRIVVFCVGAAIGLAVFSSVLQRLLTRFRRITMAVLFGLLAGSLRVLWPWPNGVGIISDEEAEAIDGTLLEWPTLSEAWLPTLLMVVFCAGVILASRKLTK